MLDLNTNVYIVDCGSCEEAEVIKKHEGYLPP